jgi:hypothetical protein
MSLKQLVLVSDELELAKQTKQATHFFSLLSSFPFSVPNLTPGAS